MGGEVHGDTGVSMKARRRWPLWLVGSLAVAIAGGVVGPVAINASEQEPLAVDSIHDGLPFDPYLEALGVRSKEDLAMVRSAQQNLAALGKDNQPEEVATARRAAFDAIDALYSAIALNPDYESIRGEWRKCMADAETPVDSPQDAEDQLAELLATDGGPVQMGETRDGVRAGAPQIALNRDACTAKVDDSLTAAVQLEYPHWIEKYAHTFAAYRTQLESYAR